MRLNTLHKVLVGVAVFSLLGFILLKNRKKSSSPLKVLFLGGLDTRKNDKDISVQSKLLQEGLGDKYSIKAYRYTNGKELISDITKNSKVIVVMFSAGCSQSFAVAKAMKNNNQKLSNVYIVEPYHSGGTTTKSVQKAVELGVPQKNVLVGTNSNTGLGVVSNTTQTPKCSPKHWCSLTKVGEIISK
jgi:hypothetical protein